MVKMDCSIIIPTLNSSGHLLNQMLKNIHDLFAKLNVKYEIIIIGSTNNADLKRAVSNSQEFFIEAPVLEYGEAIKQGFQHGKGDYFITLDSGHSTTLEFLKTLWENRYLTDILIASRYINGGKATMPIIRKVISKVFNILFSRGLDLGVKDFSSGFRLYSQRVVKNIAIESHKFDFLQELLVKAYMQGYQIREIPFHYKATQSIQSYTQVLNFGLDYLKSYSKFWSLRNSISSADYDARAYNSLVPPQRYWQRQRFKHISRLIQGQGMCLDSGCGSSQIIGSLPRNSIALDIQMNKLRYSKKYGKQMLQGSALNLPLKDNCFPCVLSSQVIEHITRDNALEELHRVLKPGGLLVLGTPDYSKWQWVFIEWLYKKLLPQAYADEHITHYTLNGLLEEFIDKRGYKLEEIVYILQGELILALRKPNNPII